MFMKLTKHLIFFLLVSLFISCVAPIEDVAQEEQNTQAKIINGNSESGHSYVVSLVGSNGASECTGTIIAPRVVLTAAHCIISDYGVHPPSTIEIGSVVGANGNARILVSFYLIREGWQMRTGGFDYNFDIALLYLDRDAPVRGTGYSRTSPSDVINQNILAIGYGNNNGFQDSGGGIKRSVNLTITESYQFHFIATWRNGVPLDTCQGDSGGPALFLGSRGMEVLGVVLNGPTFCQGST
jgi:secreted trypsin-like serine protease